MGDPGGKLGFVGSVGKSERLDVEASLSGAGLLEGPAFG